MLEKVDVILCKGAEVAAHVEVKGLVVVINRAEVSVYDNFSVKLFVNFPDERLLLRFARFDLATGKLPAAFKLAIATLRRQNMPISLDNSCYYVNGFHDVSF